jgi:ketosteroid isomerase-like protein
MRNPRILLFAVLALTALFSSTTAAQPTPSDNAIKHLQSKPDDEKTVRQLSQEFVAAFRLNNPTTIARLEEIIADDFCQISMDGKLIQGKKDNLLYYRRSQQRKQENWKSYAVRYEIQSVKISCDLAVVLGKIEAEGRRKDAPEAIGRDFMETLVFQKNNDKWYLIQEQSTGIKKRGKHSKTKEPAA